MVHFLFLLSVYFLQSWKFYYGLPINGISWGVNTKMNRTIQNMRCSFTFSQRVWTGTNPLICSLSIVIIKVFILSHCYPDLSSWSLYFGSQYYVHNCTDQKGIGITSILNIYWVFLNNFCDYFSLIYSAVAILHDIMSDRKCIIFISRNCFIISSWRMKIFLW